MKKNRKCLMAEVLLTGCVAAALLTGCSGGREERNGSVSDSGENVSGDGENGGALDQGGGSLEGSDADFGLLYETADLNGKVTEFTDRGFSAKQIVVEGDTAQIALDAEPGESGTVTVRYGENTVFQRASVSTATETVSGLTDGDKSGIKKESQVLVYGTYESSGVLKADKVIRLVWE